MVYMAKTPSPHGPARGTSSAEGMAGDSTAERASVQALEGREIYTLPEATQWGRAHRNRRERRLFKFLSPSLVENAVILEIGSGRGEFAEIVRDRGFRYVGVEPSTEMRDSLVTRGFEILSEPVPPIRLEDQSVDCVYSSALIEHLGEYATVVEYFREAYRVLKKGGCLISIVPNCDTLGPIFYAFDYQHSFVTNQGRMEHLARDTGFRVETCRCFLRSIGLTAWAPVDRVGAHLILLVMRRRSVYSLIRWLFGGDLCLRVYKNIFDQIVVVSRKD